MSKSINQKLKSCFYEFVRDEEGYHLVDRNGAYFAYILDFLRDSKIVLPQDPAEIKKILKEANFFAVQVNFSDKLLNFALFEYFPNVAIVKIAVRS